MNRPAEPDDEAWRAIVDNYGERALTDADEQRYAELFADDNRWEPGTSDHAGDTPSATLDLGGRPRSGDAGGSAGGSAGGDRAYDDRDERDREVREREERLEAADLADRFVPPTPPPLPVPPPVRFAAWAGILVPPVFLILVAAVGLYPPSVLGWGMLVWFLASFAYLLTTMDRDPRDPWDNGARL